MRILFISDNFPPEVNATASRTYEHAARWVEAGAQVTILTCAPNFPQGKLYPGYRNAAFQREMVAGIEVVRLWSYMAPNEGFLKRVIDYGSFAASAAIAGLFQRADVIVATSPQFFTTWAGQFLGTIKRRPWVFELRDLWPASLEAVGAMRPGRTLRALERIELFLYRHAAAVVANTPALRTNLISRGIAPEKIFVVTNGANLASFTPRPKDPGLLASLDLADKFVVGYIGTLGMAHGLDMILDSVAELPRDRLRFLFVGDGAEKAKIRAKAQAIGLSNAIFLDPVPRERVPNYLSLADVSLVPLRRAETFKTVIPSKIFECAAMQVPILLGVEGQAQDLVTHYDAGLCFAPESRGELQSKLLMLMQDPSLYRRLQAGCARLAADYDRKRLADDMLAILQNVAGRTRTLSVTPA